VPILNFFVAGAVKTDNGKIIPPSANGWTRSQGRYTPKNREKLPERWL